MERPDGDLPGGDGDLPDLQKPGAIEAQVRSDVEALISEHPMGESLGEMAFAAARRLDRGVSDISFAGISKELRETLVELASMKAGDDDDLAAALSVPTSLRDASEY